MEDKDSSEINRTLLSKVGKPIKSLPVSSARIRWNRRVDLPALGWPANIVTWPFAKIVGTSQSTVRLRWRMVLRGVSELGTGIGSPQQIRGGDKHYESGSVGSGIKGVFLDTRVGDSGVTVNSSYGPTYKQYLQTISWVFLRP